MTEDRETRKLKIEILAVCAVAIGIALLSGYLVWQLHGPRVSMVTVHHEDVLTATFGCIMWLFGVLTAYMWRCGEGRGDD